MLESGSCLKCDNYVITEFSFDTPKLSPQAHVEIIVSETLHKEKLPPELLSDSTILFI